MPAPDYLSVLRREFEADNGSFLFQLRCNGRWDKASFDRLVNAMEECCRAHEGEAMLERWVANGFWFLDTTVRDQTMKSGMRLEFPSEYYEVAFQRLSELAYWYFFGEQP